MSTQEQTEPVKPESQPPLGGIKRILFPFALFLTVVVFFALAELSLRILFPALRRPFVTEISIDQKAFLRLNRRYLEKYFPDMRSAIVPELRPTVFAREKGPNTFRVVCLGESSMFGTPYEMNANIPAIVRKQLRHLYPRMNIEVINLGASAINSSSILDLAKEIVRYQPDLVLVYMGHNEFYGPDGVGASFLQRHFPSTIQWVYALRDFRLFRLGQRLADSMMSQDTTKKENLMESVSHDQMVSLSSAAADRVFALFERNLRNILRLFRDAHVPVIVSDVTSNLSFPPFESEALPALTDSPAFEKTVLTEYEAKHYTALEDTLDALAHLYPTNAFVQYWLGRTCEAAGKSQQALVHLRTARDNDLLKFRAPAKINTIIRAVCAGTNTPFVSADSLFSSISPGGVADTNLFWEHLHPNVRGYYEIASLFLRKIQDLHLLPVPEDQSGNSTLLPLNMDSLSICWLDLAFADISMRNLTTHWPFSNYRSASVVIEKADPELQQLAWSVYTYRLGWTEGCYRTALYFERTQHIRQAQTTFDAILEDNPYDFYGRYLLAVLLKDQGHISQAMEQYRKSIDLNATYPYPRIDLGLLLINLGHSDEAISQLRAALNTLADKNLPTEKASIYYGLSAASANKGDLHEALSLVDSSLTCYPNYSAAQSLRASLLTHLGVH